MRKDIAVLGYGQRGMIYGEYARFRPEEFRVAAVIDTDAEKRRLASGVTAVLFLRITENFFRPGFLRTR